MSLSSSARMEIIPPSRVSGEIPIKRALNSLHFIPWKVLSHIMLGMMPQLNQSLELSHNMGRYFPDASPVSIVILIAVSISNKIATFK